MAGNPTIDEIARLKKYLETRLKGQSKAISSVCRSYEYIVTLRDLEQKKGPLGTFLFLGPSGVGKTEMARLMAAYFSGSENALIKISCASFSQPHMVHSIIGAPHGYIGFDKKPVLSQEYIDSKVGRKKMDASLEQTELNDLNYRNKKLLDSIQSLEKHLASIEYKVETSMTLINFLGSYDKLINNGGGELGEKSLREMLSDSDIKEAITSLISKNSMNILKQDIRQPLGNMAMIMELYATTKGLVQLYQHGHEQLERASYYQGYMNEMAKTMKEERALVVASEPSTKGSPKIVILFDEIEKGNETLHNLLLEIMEDGKVTLANNKITDLSNAFIVLTGNMGAKLIGDIMKGRKFFGFSGPSKQGVQNSENPKFENLDSLEKSILAVAEKELDKVFSPEFRGRIDDIVVFRPLPLNSFHEILDYQIELFQIALMSSDIELEIDDAVKGVIVEQSLHRPEVGARLLSHKFKSLVKIPLGRELANRKNFKGRVRASSDNSKIKFEFN